MLNRRQRLFAANNGGAFQIPRAGLALAVDAALGVTASGGFASAWADQSGNGRSLLQATGANQPIHLPFVGTKYGWLPGVVGNYFSTPDSVANSITGDIDIRVKVALADWTPAAAQTLVGKIQTGSDRSYYLQVAATTGYLTLSTSPDGTGASVVVGTSTVAPTVADGAAIWVRVTLDVNDGAGNRVYKFYTSSDGTTWTQLGNTVTTAGATTIYNSISVVEIGSTSLGTSPATGKIYQAQIYNGIDGTLAVDFDASRWTSGTTFTASTGETWTINSTGSKPAQIVDRPSLLFDGSAHYMKCDAFTLNQPETVYLVAKQVSWTSGDDLFDGNLTATMMLQQTTGGASPQNRIYANSFVGSIDTVAVGSTGVICGVFNGASSSVQANNGAAVTGDAGSANAGGFTIGSAGGGTFNSNIQAYEALIYNTAHDAATRSNIIRALMSKHGVA